MTKVIQSNYRVSLTPAADTAGGGHTPPAINGFWATSEGGAITRERANIWDGGAGYDIAVGKVTADDITLTRPYDPKLDDAWLDQLRLDMSNGELCQYNVAKTAHGANSVAIGKTETHNNCPVLTVRTSPTAAGPEATAATIEMVLATKGPTNSPGA